MEIKCLNCDRTQPMKFYGTTENNTTIIEIYKCPNCGSTAQRILKVSSLTHWTKYGMKLKTEKY